MIIHINQLNNNNNEKAWGEFNTCDIRDGSAEYQEGHG
jgi:hypothetical protein